MTWTFRECEDDAAEIRAMAEVPANDVLEAREIGRSIGLTFTTRAPRGCAGQLDVESGTIYLHTRGYAWTQNFGNAHELTHFHIELSDGPTPHDEDRVDWGAVALLMPRAAVLDALAVTGIESPAALIKAFPDVPPAWVLLRCAWVLGQSAAVHINGRRVWVPEDHVGATVVSIWELRLVRLVRLTMQRQQTINGAVAIPVGEKGVDGVLVLYAEETGEW